MADYFVSIDNEEVNELANTVSLTGTVNGSQCAVLIRLSSLAGKSATKAKAEKQKALIQAYEGRGERKVAGAEKVSL